MPSAGDEYNGRPVAVLLSPLFDPDFSLDPGKVASSRFFAEELLIIANHFCHDPATGNVIVVDEDESPGCLKRRRHIERHRSLGSQGQLSHLIAIDSCAALLLIQSHCVNYSLDRLHLTLHLFAVNPQEISTALFQRTFP